MVFINRKNAIIAFSSQQVLLIISYTKSSSFILKIELSLLTKPIKNTFPTIFMDKFCKKEQLWQVVIISILITFSSLEITFWKKVTEISDYHQLERVVSHFSARQSHPRKNCTWIHRKSSTARTLTGNSSLFGSVLATHLLSAFGGDARFMEMLLISPGLIFYIFITFQIRSWVKDTRSYILFTIICKRKMTEEIFKNQVTRLGLLFLTFLWGHRNIVFITYNLY